MVTAPMVVDRAPEWTLESFLQTDYYDPIETLPETPVARILAFLAGSDAVKFLEAYAYARNFSSFQLVLRAQTLLRIEDPDVWPVLKLRHPLSLDQTSVVGCASRLFKKIVFFGVDNMGFVAACKMDPQVKNVVLNISDEPIGPQAAKFLGSSLMMASTITQLSLNNNNIGSEAAVRLATSFQYSNLTHLVMENNPIGAEGVIAICESLQNSQIKYLRNSNTNNRSRTCSFQ
jgi:hypothetical protein